MANKSRQGFASRRRAWRARRQPHIRGHRRTALHANLVRRRVWKKMQNWYVRGAGENVMWWLREGVNMDMLSKPPPPFHQGDSLTKLLVEEETFVKKELPRCLSSGAWVQTQYDRLVSKEFFGAQAMAQDVSRDEGAVQGLPACSGLSPSEQLLQGDANPLRDALGGVVSGSTWRLDGVLRLGGRVPRGVDSRFAPTIHDSESQRQVVLLCGSLFRLVRQSDSPAVFVKIAKVLTHALRAPDLEMSGGRDAGLSKMLQTK
jgi:hypothetical protein